MKNVGRRRGSGPWYGNEGDLARFEWGALRAYPTLSRKTSPFALEYTAKIPVPGYEPRSVRLEFQSLLTPESVRIYADGPSDSPHRYTDIGTLCVWYPRDPNSRRWLKQDGLRALLDLIALHLFKEAYWRDTDEWLGDEAPHGQIAKVHADTNRQIAR